MNVFRVERRRICSGGPRRAKSEAWKRKVPMQRFMTTAWGFVMIEKTAVSAFDVGQITQESLFGDSDPVPEQEDVAEESEPAKPEEE